MIVGADARDVDTVASEGRRAGGERGSGEDRCIKQTVTLASARRA